MWTNRFQTTNESVTRLGFFGRLVRRFREVHAEREMLEINRRRPGFGGTSRYY
jgi:hypothetical protein